MIARARVASGSGKPLILWGGSVLAALALVFCGSGTTAAASAPATARTRSTFGQSLSLAVSLGGALRAGQTAVTANFALTNTGSAVFDGCFGQSWGVSVIVGGHYAGFDVGADHPRCDEKLTLLPNQTIVWSKKVPLNDLREGTAKVTAWVKVIDPATCAQPSGCREVSVPSPLMTLAVGPR